MPLMPVSDARARILEAITPMVPERVPLAKALGRVLAGNVVATRSQPPADLSAMDGYAVRADDVQTVPARLSVVGEAAAGSSYDKPLKAGEAVRIFTGAPLPAGADSIVIQENTERYGDYVIAREKAKSGAHIRRAGLDFKEGDVGLSVGRKLSPADIAYAAAMNVPVVIAHKRPKIGFFSTGNELVLPGATPGPHQIVSSNNDGLSALIESAGGEPFDLGIIADDIVAIQSAGRHARDCDMLVTLGGASVGDHDLVQSALTADGLTVDFWRIAMRPGKPLMFGRYRDIPMLGLPGNPVSAMVCAHLFLLPAIAAMQGLHAPLVLTRARLGAALAANDKREDYLRGTLVERDNALPVATAFERQDSSMLSAMSAADCLIVRAPNAAAAAAGDMVSVLRLR
ncbi:MAG: molybdopterin molybdotransferase MoeA [Parvibaculum sp.]|nr:molybdopterin molybdotransferase MoeA [Parvibaculum sp.]